jgi:hypothetical protein
LTRGCAINSNRELCYAARLHTPTRADSARRGDATPGSSPANESGLATSGHLHPGFPAG